MMTTAENDNYEGYCWQCGGYDGLHYEDCETISDAAWDAEHYEPGQDD
jgi:hypothetical protein